MLLLFFDSTGLAPGEDAAEDIVTAHSCDRAEVNRRNFSSSAPSLYTCVGEFLITAITSHILSLAPEQHNSM